MAVNKSGWLAMGNGPEPLARIYFGCLNAAFMQPLKTGRHTSPAEDQA